MHAAKRHISFVHPCASCRRLYRKRNAFVRFLDFSTTISGGGFFGGIIMNLPKDPVMLLSVVNTQLRDHYPNLSELAAACMADADELSEKLAAIGYRYDPETNQFR
jgi:hypothetical protein